MTHPQQPMFAHTPARSRMAGEGYPATPGTGPAGETCRNCANLRRVDLGHNPRFKCRLTLTLGHQSNIRISAPACVRFVGKTPRMGDQIVDLIATLGPQYTVQLQRQLGQRRGSVVPKRAVATACGWLARQGLLQRGADRRWRCV